LITLTAFLISFLNRFESPVVLILLGLLISAILAFFYFYLNYYLFLRGFWLPIFPVGAIILTGVATLFYLLTSRITNYIHNLEDQVKLKTQDLSIKNQQLTEKIQLIENQQQQLINQEKLAFLGRLTAGFCHQFKNPFYLTKYTIDSGINLLEKYDLDEEFVQFRESLAHAQISMDKLELLSKLILISPTRNKLSFIEAAPNHFVENIMISAVRFHSLENHSRLQTQVDLKTDPILESKTKIPQQLEIPVFNLVDNAIDAILAREAKEANFEGFIQVLTRHLDTDHWQIIVEDNGGGIPPAIKEKLFEPFVTSKADTDGIGLGLWISREMMTNFIKGEIYGESEGQKTKFYLNIPFFAQ
jgi:signal transduction histidine kinase